MRRISRGIWNIKSVSYLAPGSTVQAATLLAVEGGYGFSLKFTDGAAISVIPPPPRPEEFADPESTIADGEVLMPADRLLTVGPGQSWSYLDGNSTSAAS